MGRNISGGFVVLVKHGGVVGADEVQFLSEYDLKLVVILFLQENM